MRAKMSDGAFQITDELAQAYAAEVALEEAREILRQVEAPGTGLHSTIQQLGADPLGPEVAELLATFVGEE